ncbi:MAG: type II secretion system protein GspL [Gammaproteobacteria bacterium]|nr:MAG: type II secretion system protein GspL [Gammaproteobacteria bacterium]RKZ73931.1 MAG: type II secretion system protein GspL [Gammaproteobacteria bacterium]
MRSSLLICLQTNEQVSWAIFGATGQIIKSATDVPLDTVPHHARPPLVLIPGSNVLLTSADIPTKQWQRMVQAVPYAVEEQLADDIENLHFALGKREALSGDISVAVIARVQMEAYLQQLNMVGLTPAVLIPDILAVPKPTDGWGVLFLDNMALVRTGLYSGFAIESDCISAALQIALVEHEANPPQKIVIFSGTQVNTALTELETIPIIENRHEKGVLAWLAQGLIEHKPLNLLQNDYSPQDKVITLLRPWRLTAILLLILGGIYWLKQGVEYQQLSQQRQALQTQIETIYRKTFPKARKIVNPRVQMEQKLKALRVQKNHTTPGNHFLSILNQISTHLTRTPGFNLKRLDYRQRYFDIQLEVANLQALELLKKRLSRLDLKVEIQSAISRNNLVECRLRIRDKL